MQITAHKTSFAAGVRARARCVPWMLAVCILLLGFVVCWGLQDKASLYAHNAAHVPMAKAKLLTERERPVTQAAPVVVPEPQALAAWALLLAAAVFAGGAKLCSRALFVLRRVVGRPAPGLAPPLCRRPPPVCAAAA